MFLVNAITSLLCVALIIAFVIGAVALLVTPETRPGDLSRLDELDRAVQDHPAGKGLRTEDEL